MAPRIGMDWQSQEILCVVWVASRRLQPGPRKPWQGRPAVVHNPSLEKNQSLHLYVITFLLEFLPHGVLERPGKVISIFLEDKEGVWTFQQTQEGAWEVVSSPGPGPSDSGQAGLKDGFLSVLTLNDKQDWDSQHKTNTFLWKWGGCSLQERLASSYYGFPFPHYIPQLIFPVFIFVSIFAICLDMHI